MIWGDELAARAVRKASIEPRRLLGTSLMDHRAVLVKLAEESIFDGDGESGQPTKVAQPYPDWKPFETEPAAWG